jgi:transmembrane 9 superfamily member 2/4
MLIAAIIFALMTGTVGFMAAWWFVWKIFSAVKVD